METNIRWKQVSVSQDGGHVWGVNRNDQIYYRRGVNGKWIKVSGNLKYVSVSNGTHVWGVNKNNQIYYRRGFGGKWMRVSGGLKQISISGNGKHLWGVSSKDEIYYSTVSFTSNATKYLKVHGVARKNLKVHGLAKRNLNLNLSSVGKRNLKSKKVPAGRCGPKFRNTKCKGKTCCSKYGWCGGNVGTKSAWCSEPGNVGVQGGKFDGSKPPPKPKNNSKRKHWRNFIWRISR